MYRHSAPELMARRAVIPSYTPGATTVWDGSESSWRKRLPPDAGWVEWPFMLWQRSIWFAGRVTRSTDPVSRCAVRMMALSRWKTERSDEEREMLKRRYLYLAYQHQTAVILADTGSGASPLKSIAYAISTLFPTSIALVGATKAVEA